MRKIIELVKWFHRKSKFYVGYWENGKQKFNFKNKLYYPIALFKFIKYSWND